MTAPSSVWTLACGDVLPGCSSVLTGPTADAVLALVGDHARADHGVPTLDEGTRSAVGAALRPPA